MKAYRTPVSSSQTMSRRPLSTNISLTQRWPMFPGLLAALALGHAPGTVERRREPTRYVHMYFVKWVSSSKPMKPYSDDWYLWTSDSRSQYPNSNTEPFLKYHAFSLALHSQTLRGNFSKLRWIRDRFSSDRKSTRLNSSHVKISYAVF